ncbi:MAG: Uma2 family endonuclease [Alkalinema sp. CAN_BIN05]|nr:Uma2 family endonuclease [Alkalinema sp. CAN_BIN05]
MVASISIDATSVDVVAVIYSDCDGQPMSDNTKQFRWIVTIKENLEMLFADAPNIFVAGDLFWYPVEGNNKLRQAPDTMVAIGRPKGDRGSYQQWQEENISPQVVFEILSLGNRMGEMNRKFKFYEQYGVEEYYIYDPDRIDFNVWIRAGSSLESIDFQENFVSPCLGIRFELQDPSPLVIYRLDGQPFIGFVDLDRLRQQANSRADRAETQAQTLAAKLRELGIGPDSL